MNLMFQKAGAITAVLSLSLMLVAGILFFCGARFNISNSIPLGLYWITKNPIQKDAYVLLCPPNNTLFHEALNRGYIESGFCPGGLGYMMKRVRATGGDVVSINHNGVWVNHHHLEHSTPYDADVQGRALPISYYHNSTLKHSHLLLMTDNSELSFDGRYFGLINRSQVKAVISPVFTWISTS